MRRTSLALALLAVAACGDGGSGGVASSVPAVTDAEPATTGPPATSPADAPGSTAAPTADLPDPPPADDPAAATPPAAAPGGDEALAIADLAARTGADPDDIVTRSVENVTWRTSAVGCPQKGMQYLQVLTDGVRIVLEHDGRRYQYHAGGGRAPFYCPVPEAPLGE